MCLYAVSARESRESRESLESKESRESRESSECRGICFRSDVGRELGGGWRRGSTVEVTVG